MVFIGRQVFPSVICGLAISLVSITAARAEESPASAGQAAPMERAELEYYYRMFSDTCYMAPTDLQEETLEVSESMWQVFGGFGPPATPADFARVSTLARAHYNKVRGEYPSYRLEWSADGLVIVDQPTAPLEVTRGLERLLVLELENSTDQVMTLAAAVRETGAGPRPAIGVHGGAMMPYLVPVRIAGGEFNKLTVEVGAPGNIAGARTVTIDCVMRDTVVLSGKALDAASGETCPSRVYTVGSDGIYRHARQYAANNTLAEKQVVFRPAMKKVPFFYTPGEFVVDLPPGDAVVMLERGYETPIVEKRLVLEEGLPATIEIGASRALDMKSLGWISGDTHIHWAINAWNENEDIDLLAMVQRSEDLRVANNLTLYQWTPTGAFLKPDQYPMGPVEHLCDGEYHIQMGEEFRNDNHFGHICLLNIKKLIEPVATGQGSGGPEGSFDSPINKSIIEEARKQGGISIEAHNLGPFFASGVPVNVVHGLSDSLDQLEPNHYYNFLNCGFRIGLSNGSDHPARLAGICRVYARIDGDFTYDKWTQSVASARTFTTSGPIVFLKVNGADIGDVLNVEKGAPVRAEARVWSRYPVGTLEIVSNGAVVSTLSTDEQEATVAWEGLATESRWFTARCSRSGNFDALSGPHIAHTSAVYVDVDGKPVFKRQAAEGWISNIQIHRARLVEKGSFESEEQRKEAIDHIDSGIAKYMELIAEHESGG